MTTYCRAELPGAYSFFLLDSGAGAEILNLWPAPAPTAVIKSKKKGTFKNFFLFSFLCVIYHFTLPKTQLFFLNCYLSTWNCWSRLPEFSTSRSRSRSSCNKLFSQDVPTIYEYQYRGQAMASNFCTSVSNSMIIMFAICRHTCRQYWYL